MEFISWADGAFDLAGRRTRCALGKTGVRPAPDKREGDGATPLGRWPLRRALHRPDRLPAPQTRLPLRPIAPDDGWCDAPRDPAYNRPVRLPYPASAEALARADGLYDLIVVLGHNDDPPIPGLGSAIFLHMARPGYAPTEGCVALAKADLLALLARAAPGDVLQVRA
ncbi:MAG: L,D-transpeptidase family protein [Caulobacterales bacterium]|nr:L,D-transpeptidase family protein [Caulobacterales bacterium]